MYVGDVVVLLVGAHRVTLVACVQHPVAVVGKAEFGDPFGERLLDVGVHAAAGVAAAGGVAVEVDQGWHSQKTAARSAGKGSIIPHPALTTETP